MNFSFDWMAVAFLAPAFWALVNIADVYFVGGVYQDELDGIIISSLFQILPWAVLPFFIELKMAEMPMLIIAQAFDKTVLIAVLGGVFFTISYYCYFRALFRYHNDASLIQILWTLYVIVTPIFSFFIEGKVLSMMKYVGMGVVLLGATMLSVEPNLKERLSRGILLTTLGAAISWALSIVLQSVAFDSFAATHGENAFWVGIFYLNIGACLAGVAIMIVSRRNPLPLIRRYYHIFIGVELVCFLGTLFYEKAIAMSSSPSLVSATGTFMPAFVLIYSALIVGFCKLLKINNEMASNIYNDQLTGKWIKITATGVMAVGVYMIR